MKKGRYLKGFTLIELLIVIAIIAILATIIILNVTKASAKARDAVRKSDISSINKAIKLYYLDTGNYPECWLFCESVSANPNEPTSTVWQPTLGIALNKYIAELPVDPKNIYSDKYFYEYYRRDDETKYHLAARKLENSSDIDACGTAAKPKRIYSRLNSSGYYSCTTNQVYQDSFGFSGNQ